MVVLREENKRDGKRKERDGKEVSSKPAAGVARFWVLILMFLVT